jgi:hypothetical protein
MWVKCHECKGTGFEPNQTTIINRDGTYKYKKICERCNIFRIDRIDNFLVGYIHVDDVHAVFEKPDKPEL